MAHIAPRGHGSDSQGDLSKRKNHCFNCFDKGVGGTAVINFGVNEECVAALLYEKKSIV